MKTLEGKVVLITGASRGLGVDMAQEFAARRSRLALAARSADELEKVRVDIESMGAEAVAIPTDVAELGSLRNLVSLTEDSLGPVDVLVNNAGVESVCDFEQMPLDEIEKIISINVTGLIWLTRLVVPSMIARRQGHIVNVASMAGLVPVPHNSVYSSSKHAVVGISRSLRLELADHGVGVSVVAPGFVSGSGMFTQWGRKAPSAAGTSTPKEVATSVIKAVLEDRPEVKVARALARFGPVLHSISPRINADAMRRFGVIGFLREQARLNADRAKN